MHREISGRNEDSARAQLHERRKSTELRKAVKEREKRRKGNKPPSKLQLIFDDFDLDGDGRVTRSEFADLLLDELNLELPEKDIDHVFSILDPNGDNELRFSEFAYAFYNRRAFQARLSLKAQQNEARTRKAERHLAGPRRTSVPFVPCNPFSSREGIHRPKGQYYSDSLRANEA